MCTLMVSLLIQHPAVEMSVVVKVIMKNNTYTAVLEFNPDLITCLQTQCRLEKKWAPLIFNSICLIHLTRANYVSIQNERS